MPYVVAFAFSYLPVGASIPLGELARNLYALNKQAGRGGQDFSGVVQLLTRLP